MNESSGAGVAAEAAWWRRHLRENPALILTVTYLLLTVIGAIYNWRLCHRFGINILELADGADFLMFAVRDVVVVLWATFAIALFVGTYALLAHLKSAPPMERTALMRAIDRQLKKTDLRPTAVICVVWAVFFVYIYLDRYAGLVARNIKRGSGRACEYVLADDPKGPPQAAQLVTTTSRFVVLYRPDDKATQVIPTEGVVRLVFR
ncbi:MAG TPA: hypothetical protein PKL08_06400 [Thermoanaerobaculaceae bacterium]|nr:hypothetical protein [Thermoanaerobaculaceae bacterium]